MLDGNQAAQRREAIVVHPYTKERTTYQGDKVYAVTSLGIVIAVMSSRLFYPWHAVAMFSYHNDDVVARKVIQGY